MLIISKFLCILDFDNALVKGKVFHLILKNEGWIIKMNS